MCAASAANSEIGLLVSVYQNLGESKSQAEFKKLVAWLCVRPSVFVAMSDYQSSALGGIFETFVVVSVSTTAILNAVYVVEIVNHFVKKCCNNLFDRSCQCSCANVDFVSAAKF